MSVGDVVSRPFNRRIVTAAATWYVQLQAGDVTAAERAACERWRASDPRHEQAWQRVQELAGTLKAMPAELAQPALGREQRLDRRSAVKTLALLAIAVPVGHAGWRAQGYGADLRTATGEQRELQLADGSWLQLNTATTVDLDFDRERRLLRLRNGEIRLRTAVDIAPSPRPFIVATAHGEIRADGSALLVRRDGSQTRVAVEQGHCLVATRAATVAIDAGAAVHIGTDAITGPAPADRHAGDWTRGVLRADDMRLADFAAELGRYRPGLLRCDPAAAGLHISGAFQLRDTDSALDSLTGVLPVAIVRRSRWWTAIVPRDFAPA